MPREREAAEMPQIPESKIVTTIRVGSGRAFSPLTRLARRYLTRVSLHELGYIAGAAGPTGPASPHRLGDTLNALSVRVPDCSARRPRTCHNGG
jgi:hypothetical protein